jgi:multiple sugar transport system permease protein
VQGAWNEFTMFLVATDDPKYKTLVLGLAQFRGGLGSGSRFPLFMGATLVVTIPIIIVFFTFQRYFTGDANAGVEK